MEMAGARRRLNCCGVFGMASQVPIHRLRDRREGGLLLAGRLGAYAHDPGALVLALPRGGVPVGYEVARALGLPLDVFVVRKLGAPGREELAMGAIAGGGTYVLNEEVIAGLDVARADVLAEIERERIELERRERLYRGDLPFPQLSGKTVILVDDGLATGASMAAAVTALRRTAPARIVAAVPVGAVSVCAKMGDRVDEMICGQMPDPFHSVGTWYRDFDQVSDREVRRLLDAAAASGSTPPPGET
jgi:putative phosphoribosyl transferase